MKPQLYVVDDFYADPDAIRNYALGKDFTVSGNYPGLRTEPESLEQSEYLKKYIQDNIMHTPITYWGREYNTAFQYTTAEDSTWVHHDETKWAGVLYLTPNPPLGSGTTLYSHAKTGIYEHFPSQFDFNTSSEDAGDLSRWNKEIEVENRYNRLVIYNGMIYHRSTNAGFGTGPHDGRLFQTFFFDTER